ncbi:hypothetical protein J6590_013076 [Homalodisca vitripennis]|nr:hypothetical protein J6590_013076 [Homalodisca vitripennis]
MTNKNHKTNTPKNHTPNPKQTKQKPTKTPQKNHQKRFGRGVVNELAEKNIKTEEQGGEVEGRRIRKVKFGSTCVRVRKISLGVISVM